MSWDGSLIYTLTNESSTGGTYNRYVFNVTATGSDTLLLGIRNDPSYQALDDVSVTNAPEPASLTVLGAGLAGLGMLRRRKRG